MVYTNTPKVHQQDKSAKYYQRNTNMVELQQQAKSIFYQNLLQKETNCMFKIYDRQTDYKPGNTKLQTWPANPGQYMLHLELTLGNLQVIKPCF